jgi:hypothetical protein
MVVDHHPKGILSELKLGLAKFMRHLLVCWFELLIKHIILSPACCPQEYNVERKLI